jgi:RNA polymerase sigma factor (sigma-70 family)
MRASLIPVVRRLSRLADADLADADLLDRFRGGREEAAFALLVERHGPAVLALCRRVLGNDADAEDAFQATFLVLLRKAGSIRKRASLGSWLYGVAYRVAARARSARPAGRPATAAAPGDGPPDEAGRRELCAVLHEEIRQLPERYRAPLVLCGLEGKSCEQAARELRWPKSSLAHRLARAREALRRRLVRRGVEVPAAFVASALAAEAVAVPAPLTRATARLAAAAASGALPTSPAVTLADGVLRGAALTKWAVVLALASVLGLAVAGATLLAGPGDEPEPPAPPADAPRAQADAPRQERTDHEGVPLPAGAVARVGSARLRHGTYLYHLAYSADGKLLASTGGGSLCLWDASSGKPLFRAAIPENQFFTQGVFADDGKTVLAHGAGSFQWLDVKTGKEVRRAALGPSPKADGCLSPRGDAVAFVNAWKEVVLCDLPSGKERHKWTTDRSWDWELAFSPDGKTLAAIDWDSKAKLDNQTRTVVLYDTTTGQQRARVSWGKERLGKLTFSADGKKLMAHNLGGGVRLWDAATGEALGDLRAPNAGLVITAFSPDGSAVALGSQYVGVPLIEIRTGNTLQRFGAQPTVTSLAFSPDAKTLAVGTGTGEVTQWAVASGKMLPASADPLRGPRQLAFSADGKEVWSLADALTAHDWRTGKPTRRIAVPHDGDVHRVAVSPDRNRLAGVDAAQRLVVWDESGKVVSTLGSAARIFTASAFSPDGKRLYSGEWVGLIRVWDVAAQKEVDGFDDEKHTTGALRVSPDGALLASADHPNAEGTRPEVIVWDLAKQRDRHRLKPRPDNVRASDVAFSPDGRLLVAVGGNTGLKDGFLMAWDVATGKEKAHRAGLPQAPVCVAFAPDGRSFVTGDAGGVVRVWESATWSERCALPGHANTVQSVAFSPDGRYVASASQDAPILVWDVAGTHGKPGATAAFTADEEDRLWKSLGAADAAGPFQALRELLQRPGPSLPLLGGRLKRLLALDEKAVRELVRNLDADDFATRRSSAAELETMVEEAEPLLRQELEKATSAEVRAQLERLLRLLETPGPERLRETRALEALELIGTPEARRVLEELAKGAPAARRTREAKAALRRLGERRGSSLP